MIPTQGRRHQMTGVGMGIQHPLDVQLFGVNKPEDVVSRSRVRSRGVWIETLNDVNQRHFAGLRINGNVLNTACRLMVEPVNVRRSVSRG